MLPGEQRIKEFASKLGLPNWWVEYSVMEYLECRRFFQDREIWSFDFDIVKGNDLEGILARKIIIPASCTLFHRVDPDTLWETMAKRMVGEDAPPLKPEVIVEGRADHDLFLMVFNKPEIWDPKLSFSDRCLVLDNNRIYQWEISRFEPIPGQNRGWHKSKVPELTEEHLENLKVVNDRIQELRNRRIHEQNVDIEEFRALARKYYAELETARQPIRESLIRYHTRRVNNDVDQR